MGEKKYKGKERAWQLLGMVKEKAFYRYVGEHSQRQGHLKESRVDMTLSHVMTSEG